MPHGYMKSYVIVFRVLMMTMAIPLAGFNMNFDVSCYYDVINSEDNVSEVTTTPGVDSTGVYYLQSFAGISNQIGY